MATSTTDKSVNWTASATTAALKKTLEECKQTSREVVCCITLDGTEDHLSHLADFLKKKHELVKKFRWKITAAIKLLNGLLDKLNEYGRFGDDLILEITDEKIAKGSFGGRGIAASVELPNCTDVGEGAFYGCTKLESVNLPLCTGVGKNAFFECTSLTSVELPYFGQFKESGIVLAQLSSVTLTSCTSIP